MLVGDIILSARELFPDLPRGLNPSGGLTITASVVAVASTFPTGSYYLKLCFTNPWGQTIAITEGGPYVIADNAHSIQITAPILSACPGATGVNIYYGNNGPGSENQFISASTFPITISNPGYPGAPPGRNTSFYPDADGQRISAYSVFRWLNEGLEEASKIVGGIPDMTGLPTVAAQTMYQIPGLWNKLDHGWYDGYIINLGGRDGLFYRNVVPGVTRMGVLQQIADRLIIELQPQPSTSGGTTTVATSNVLATDSVVNCASLASFYLPFGMAMLGGPPPLPYEIISWSSANGAQLFGCIRGMGGTMPQAWPIGTPVSEGNLRLSGLRVFNNPTYFVGMSNFNLPVPTGWRAPLIDYLIGKFREAQGNLPEAKAKMQSFGSMLAQVTRGNKAVGGPRQVGQPGSDGLDTYPSAGLGGRLIIPFMDVQYMRGFL